MGVRAIMKKYGLEYEDRDIINDSAQYAEMVEKSGQPISLRRNKWLHARRCEW